MKTSLRAEINQTNGKENVNAYVLLPSPLLRCTVCLMSFTA